MLEIKDYTTAEIITELDVSPTVQNIRACVRGKLNRLGVEYEISGRGATTTYHIKSLPDEFKSYCIDHFGCAPNTDFKKMREVLFFALNDPDFLALPDSHKEQFLKNRKINISRGTIKGYIQRLEHADYLGGAEPVYLVVRKYKTHIESEIVSKAFYCEGWKIYWEIRYEQGCEEAYANMYTFLNGHPMKHLRPLQNAVMMDEIEELQRIIADSYEKDRQYE